MQEALISLSKSVFSSPLLGDTFRDGYYKTLYDIQCRRGFNLFSTIDSEIVENALTYPWSGANFSDRLWKNKNALMDSLRETLTKGMIRGDNIREMSKNIAEKLNASYSNAERLILTESSHIHNTAELSAYEAAGYEQYEFMASPGEKTCEVCGELDGKRFKLSEKQYGVNFPPIHPRCRCTTIGFDPEDEEDEKDAIEEGHGDGFLPYEEWYSKFVENGVDKSAKSGIMKLSSKFINPNEPLYKNADKIKPLKGYGDIVIHGSPDSLLINGLNGEQWEYTAKEAAEMIRNSQEFHGQPIRLISCQAGAKKNGIAQQIADELGVEVLAPTEIVNVDINGNMFLSDNGDLAEIWNISSEEERKHIAQTGRWQTFKPNKR